MTSKKKKDKSNKKMLRSRLQRHVYILVWKCYLQRQRRWGLLFLECLFASGLFLTSVFIAKPVFLTPLQERPEPPMSAFDIMETLDSRNILGYAPNIDPYDKIMNRVSILLGVEVMSGVDEDELNEMLYNQSLGTPLRNPVIWVIWQPKDGNVWRLSIRSTERARYMTSSSSRLEITSTAENPHLKAGFLAVQVAISQTIVEYSSTTRPEFELNLVSMPVSPLMQQEQVGKALSGILLCLTLALLPPVLETEALVVTETVNNFKRALRLRNVSFPTMYVSWLVYAYMTALPICMLGSINLILVFRWIHLLAALMVMMSYMSVMIMVALMMAMFHSKSYIACIWTTLFTLLQTYLAELLVHHQYDHMHSSLTFVLHLIIPPMGLVHALNEFALLQTGQGHSSEKSSLMYMVFSWTVMNVLYFFMLMLLQRTIGHKRAIGGQVSWKTVLFKKIEDTNKVHRIEPPSGSERGKLQEVDEFMAKAISFRDVNKSIMGVSVLNNITLDIYRGEFTILSSERIQKEMVNTMDDLITGLTYPDQGSVNVLGQEVKPGCTVMTSPQMMGYLHRPETLIEDLTVVEHFTLFSMICLWNWPKIAIYEYCDIRTTRLLKECDLESVKNERVRNLSMYYRAQLSWALAMLLEPRIIMIPTFSEHPVYLAVVKDKIMQHKGYLTIVALFFSSLNLECADRIFFFDSKVLVFGGTPAYMFFKYGREYRIRVTLKAGWTSEDMISKLLNRAKHAGAKVRAHLGSLLILRISPSPTSVVAALVKDLTENMQEYGITTFNISVPDTEEVCRRAITESRESTRHAELHHFHRTDYEASKRSLLRISEPLQWKRQTSMCNMHFRQIVRKFIAFHVHHKIFFTLTILAALAAGVFLGLSLAAVLTNMDPGKGAKKIISGEFQTMTVENLEQRTTLVLRADNSTEGQSIATAYVMSDTGATEKQIKYMSYTALDHKESLSNYLVTRAIDSPQHYVYMYAYGMDVGYKRKKLRVRALYSPIHQDLSAAARSLARVYMALLRHYSGHLDASIQIDDDPLALDLSPWMKDAMSHPFFIQFLLIVTISHITLLPSEEFGLIRHNQKHALNFSPARYWFTLYFCDLVFYWMLVLIMSVVMIGIMYLTVPMANFEYADLFVVPLMLVAYGVGCVPQAYIFSLGPRMALNAISFIIVNLVFGETTVLPKIFIGASLDFALEFMSLSPQLNMAYAYIKIKQIFLYNSECIIILAKNLCTYNTFHKCCQKCGVLQECFSRKSYMNRTHGVVTEVISMLATGLFFIAILFLIEYKVFHRLYLAATYKLATRDKPTITNIKPGAEREKQDAISKRTQMTTQKKPHKVDTFGEYLLATDVTKTFAGKYVVHNLYLGIGKGEAFCLAGLKGFGRTLLCEILAGYKMPSYGDVWCMSKWNLRSTPHLYCQQVTLDSDRPPLPPWLTVKHALELIATLRGVPHRYVKQEVVNYIEALELQMESKSLICEMNPTARTRMHFAAAVIGAPPVIVLDECNAYQKFSVRRAMYNILFTLRKRGHAIFVSSSSIETHLPITNRIGIFKNASIHDLDTVESLVERYSKKGCTVVVHLKDEVDIDSMFSKHFQHYVVNDTSEVLVNVQIYDDLTWAVLFEKMEMLKEDNSEVYSYIVTVIPVDYIYNIIVSDEKSLARSKGLFSSWQWSNKLFCAKSLIRPSQETIDNLVPFTPKYEITKLKELPWSVIFHK